MKNIILGIGNNILTDDGIGIYIVNQLKSDFVNVEMITTSNSGFGIVDQIVDYDRAILIDSILTGRNEIGDVNVYFTNDFSNHIPFSIHSTDLISALKISKIYGMNVPKEIYLLAIEIKDNFTFNESFSDEIEAMKESIYNNVRVSVGDILKC
ncbi:MAG: hydrogenase maturation protease [Candidatus Marinimicrobia bacterium]|nr:hydrogenase maturation protease [Candidatus Neomarinimicrobiota bacterium]